MQKNTFIEKFTLLLGNTSYHVNVSIFAVAISAFAMHFTKATSTQISMIISLPAIFMIPGVLIGGKLQEFVKPKLIILVGLFIVGIGGFATMFMPSIEAVLVTRAIVGFGIGLASPVQRALIPRLYPDQFGKLFGYQSTIGSIISFTFAIIVGILAAISWKYPEYLFLLTIIIAFMVMIFIPNVDPVKKQKVINTSDVKESLGFGIYLLLLFAWFVFMLMTVMQIKQAMLIIQGGFGNSVTAGTASSLLTVGSFFGSLIFIKIFGKQPKLTLLIATALTSIGYLLLAKASSLAMIFAGVVIAGFASIGMIIPWCLSAVGRYTPKTRLASIMSILTALMYFGQFCTAYLIEIVQKISGSTSPKTSLLFVGICFIGLTGCVVIWMAIPNKKPQKPSLEK